MSSRPIRDPRGPFIAEQIHDGDRYELSHGHPIYCAPAGKDHAGGNLIGARVLGTDPDVEWAGIDAGFSPEPGGLRAPDIAVGKVAKPPRDGQGWIPGAPPLAVEYAGVGQEEADLKQKIAELLTAGARWVWVVRLVGPRRVEVHAPNAAVRILTPGDRLEAPGVLRNPVPVEALFDARAADEAALRNLLQRHGYADLDAVRSEGQAEGQALAVLQLLEGRGLAVSPSQRERILGCRDNEQLRDWLLRAAVAADAAELFAGPQASKQI